VAGLRSAAPVDARERGLKLLVDTIDTPLGELLLAVRADDAHVCALEFADGRDRVRRALHLRFPDAEHVRTKDPGGHARRVCAYFAGDLDAFAGMPVAGGGTPFQERVWAALCDIRPGATRSYSQIAHTIGAPRAVRAVGLANGRNPIAIAVPCHRVIGADGSLTGYGGGIERKRWLLRHEGATLI
jgi:methylated-DNA-[protein]-cysteine S-methyltransferase